MAGHPLNLALRFVLEIAALAALAFWGWAWGSPWRWPLAILLPLVAMAVWGVFRVPGDSGGSQNEPPVAVPGILPLAIELVLFGSAVAALLTAQANSRATVFAVVLAIVVIVHYVISWNRIVWLLRG